jgi:hypothetical protein
LLKLNDVGEIVSHPAALGTPVPVSATVTLPDGSVNVSAPVRVPAAVGVKVTFSVQLLPPASFVGHKPVLAKSPLIAAITGVAVVPEFVSVTVCTGLFVLTSCVEKIRLSGDAVTMGVALVPVPAKLTAWGAPLLVTERIPVRGPIVVGVNVTVIRQLVAGAKAAPQLFV